MHNAQVDQNWFMWIKFLSCNQVLKARIPFHGSCFYPGNYAIEFQCSAKDLPCHEDTISTSRHLSTVCFKHKISHSDPSFRFKCKFQSISLTIDLKSWALFRLFSWTILNITFTENQSAQTSFFTFLWLKEKWIISLNETERSRNCLELIVVPQTHLKSCHTS